MQNSKAIQRISVIFIHMVDSIPGSVLRKDGLYPHLDGESRTAFFAISAGEFCGFSATVCY